MGYSFSPHLKSKNKKFLLELLKKIHLSRLSFPDTKSWVKIGRKIVLVDYTIPIFNRLDLVVVRSKVAHTFKVVSNRVFRFGLKSAHFAKRKRKQLIMTALFGFFVLSVGVGLKRQWDYQEFVSFSKNLHNLESKIEEAISLAKLNPLKSKRIFEEVGQELSSLETNSLGKEQVLGIRTKFDQAKSLGVKIYNESDFETLSTLNQDFQPTLMSSIGDELYLLDPNTGVIEGLDKVSKKTSPFVQSPLLQDSHAITVFENILFILGKNGLYKIETPNSDLVKVVDSDNEWGNIVGIDNYQGKNIYLLDKGNGKTWKYQQLEKTWSGKKNYLLGDPGVDYKNASSFGVDGNIWFIFEDGGIVKTVKGKREDFNIGGLNSLFGKNTIIRASETLNNMYILDRSNNRLVFLNKIGNYVDQYTSVVFGSSLYFDVNEKEKKLYFLSQGKVYGLGLK